MSLVQPGFCVEVERALNQDVFDIFEGLLILKNIFAKRYIRKN